eukprot:1191773-Prorocentrum_minimum.AAC.3
MQDVLALLAYEDPYTAPPVAHFLTLQQREVVADVLNEAILDHILQGHLRPPHCEATVPGRPLQVSPPYI